MCFNITILMPAHKLAGQWPTQNSYKQCLVFQKECCRPCDFCGDADQVGRAYHTCITFSYLYQITLY